MGADTSIWRLCSVFDSFARLVKERPKGEIILARWTRSAELGGKFVLRGE